MGKNPASADMMYIVSTAAWHKGRQRNRFSAYPPENPGRKKDNLRYSGKHAEEKT